MSYSAPNVERLAAAAHYIIARTEPDKLGAIKLNKILWYADLEHYRRTGESITGVDHYVRMPMGPVPEGVDYALFELKKQKRILERRTKVFDYERREFIWLSEPNISIFSVDQIDIINIFIDLIKVMTADEISRITHEDEMWKELANGDPMPIGSCSIISRTPTEAELMWASECDLS